MLKILLTIMLLSCASRGLKISEQIPEYHPEYYQGRKMVFAYGGDKNKIMFQNVDHKITPRAMDQEEDRIAINHLKYDNKIEGSTKVLKSNRSIASIAKYEEDVVYVAPKIMYSKEETYQIKSHKNENIEEIAMKYLGSKEKLYELMLHNPHLFQIKEGDTVNIPSKDR